jgi:hypothetical protein
MGRRMALILAVFAVYRLATDLAWESGPFDLYSKLRGVVITKYGASSWQAEGIGCPICWSFWLSLPALYWGPLEWLGIAGAVAFLTRVHATD